MIDEVIPALTYHDSLLLNDKNLRKNFEQFLLTLVSEYQHCSVMYTKYAPEH